MDIASLGLGIDTSGLKKAEEAFDRLASKTKESVNKIDVDLKKVESGLKSIAVEAGKSGTQIASAYKAQSAQASQSSQVQVAAFEKLQAEINKLARSAQTGFGALGKAMQGNTAAIDALSAKMAKLNVSASAANASLARTAQSTAQATAGVQGMRGATDQLLGSFKQLQNIAIGAFVGVALTRRFIDVADSATKLSGSLRIATKDFGDYGQALEDVRRISNEAQAETQTVANFYARLARNTQNLGVTQADVAKITENVTLALKTQGNTTVETNSVLLQLSQAFASGVLRGEEFNTVSENGASLLDILAKAMGEPRERLRELAFAGEITGQTLVRAFSDRTITQGIREQAENVKTLSGALTVVRNALVQYVGESSESSGITRRLSELLGSLATNFNTVAEATIALGSAYGTIKIANFAQGLADTALALKQQTLEAQAQTAATLQQARAEQFAATQTVRRTQAELSHIAVQKARLENDLAIANANVARAAQDVASTTNLQAKTALHAVLNYELAQEEIARNALNTVTAKENALLATNTAALNAQKVATDSLTDATARWVAVKRGASALVTALGGPVGALVTVLGLGATAWALWGSSVEEASDKADDFNDDTPDLLDSLEQINKKLKTQIETLETRNKLFAQGLSAELIEDDVVVGLVQASEELVKVQRAVEKVTSASDEGKRKIALKEVTAEYGSLGNAMAREIALRQRIKELNTDRLRRDEASAINKQNQETKNLADFTEKFASKAEQADRAVAEWKEKLGSLFTSEIEQKIRDKYIKPTTDSANATDRLVESLQDYVTEQDAQIKQGEKLTKAQKLELDLLKAFNGLLPENVKALVAKAKVQEEELEVTEALAKAMEEAEKYLEDLTEQSEKATKASEKRTTSLEKGNAKLEEEIRGIRGLLDPLANAEASYYDLAAAQAQVNADAKRKAGFEQEAQQLEAEAQANRERARLLREKQAAEIEKELQDANQEFYEGLLNAWKKGYDEGIDYVQDQLKRQVFQISINAFLGNTGELGRALSNVFGTGAGTGGGISGLLSGVNSVQSLYSAFSGGLTSSLAGGIASLGSTFGSSALSSFAAGMKGSTLAAGLAGPTTAGAAGATGLGAAAASAVPFVAGALAVYQIAKSFKGEKRTDDTAVFRGGQLSVTSGNGRTLAPAATREITQTYIDSINNTLRALGSSTSLSNFEGKLQTSGKGRGGVYAAGQLSTGVGVGDVFRQGRGYENNRNTSPNAELAFELYVEQLDQIFLQSLQGAMGVLVNEAGELRAGYENAIAIDLNKSIQELNNLGISEINGLFVNEDVAISSGIAPAIREFLLSIGEVENLDTEGLRFAKDLLGQLTLLSTAFEPLGGALANVTQQSADVAVTLLRASGGFAGLQQAVNNYVAAIYTDSEKLDLSAQGLFKAFDQIGVAVPATKEEFRSLVDGIDLTTAGSADLYAKLLQLAPAFSETQTAVADTIKDVYENVFGVEPETKEVERWIDQVLQSGKSIEQVKKSIEASIYDIELVAERLNLEFPAANPEKVSDLAKQVVSGSIKITDAYEQLSSQVSVSVESVESIEQAYARLNTVSRTVEQIAQERINLEQRLFNATATTAEQQQRALEAIDPYNRALYEQVLAAEEAKQAQIQLAQEQQRLDQQRISLEQRLLQASGDVAAIRNAELEAIDESNRALLERIFALQDEVEAERIALQAAQERAQIEQAIAQERAGLEQRLLQIQGDTNALRQLEIDALDESNRELLRTIFALEDAAEAEAERAEAAQRAADAALRAEQELAQERERIAQERFNLEGEILRLLGDTAALRERELAAIAPANRDLQRRIFALEDEARAQEEAQRAIEEAQRAAEQSLREQQRLQQEIARERVRALEDERRSVESFLGASQRISDYLRGLTFKEATLSPLAKLQGAQSEFDRLFDLAQGGDLEALQSITSVADSLLGAGQDFFGSGTDYQNILADVKDRLGSLADVQTFEERLLELNQQILDAQNSTTEATTTSFEGLGVTVQSSIGVVSQSIQDLIQKTVFGFNELDTNLDGVLTFEELQAGLEGLATDEQLRAIFAELDINGDGVISQLEALETALVSTLTFGFSSVDTNLDGLLTFEELKEGFKGLATDAQLLEIFEELDINGDGVITQLEALEAGLGKSIAFGFDRLDASGNGLLTFEELSSALFGLATDEQLKAIFTELDVNGDGLIEKIEAFQVVLVDKIASVFDSLDLNVDELLTFEELQAGLSGLASDEQLKFIFNELDANGNGVISRLESLQASLLNQLRSGFGALDTNLDGLLNFQELRAGLGEFATNGQLQAIFNALDTDLSGTLSAVEVGNTLAKTSNEELASIDQTVFNIIRVVTAVENVRAQLVGVNSYLFPIQVGINDLNALGNQSNSFLSQILNRLDSSNSFLSLMFDRLDSINDYSSVTANKLSSVITVNSNEKQGEFVKFAKGGAFTNSIVNSPTPFNMGLMGEAGPEAIMPLSRGRDGSLGVRITGGMNMGEVVNELREANKLAIAQIRLAQASAQQAMSDNAQMREELQMLRKKAQLEASR